jgi:hypothetical protein
MLKIFRVSIFIFLIITQLCYTACSPTRAIVTTMKVPYQASPIKIDGIAADWKNTPFTFDPATTLRYAISNDTANLYLCVTATTAGLERKIFHMGMKVYFDTSGQRREACGVQFPMPVDDNAFQLIAAAGNGQEKSSFDEYRKFIKLQENQYETFGFPGGGNGMNALGSSDYISVAFDLDAEDIFIYELKIPLKSLYGGPIPPGAFSKEMSLGLDIPGVPKSDDPNAAIPSEIGMPGSNMTGARIGMGKGGGLEKYGNGYYNQQTLYKAQRSWFKFMLSAK